MSALEYSRFLAMTYAEWLVVYQDAERYRFAVSMITDDKLRMDVCIDELMLDNFARRAGKQQ